MLATCRKGFDGYTNNFNVSVMTSVIQLPVHNVKAANVIAKMTVRLTFLITFLLCLDINGERGILGLYTLT